MKIAFVGSREYPDKDFVEKKVEEYIMEGWVDYVNKVPNHQFVSGGARGVDTWAYDAARPLGGVCWVFPADWIKHGKAAGVIRNQLIVDESDLIVAFWDGESKGTKHTIDLAIKAGKPVDIYIRKNKKEKQNV